MVKVFRLVNGEDVIAKIVGESGSPREYILENPMQVMITPTPTGYGISVGPWLPPYTKQSKTITIAGIHVLAELDADPEMENAYNSKTGGIVTAPAGILMP